MTGITGTGVVRALGAMSGTSLDGVDAAVVETDGHRIHGFGPVAYRPYTPGERAVLRAGLGLWSGPEVGAAAHVVDMVHAGVLRTVPDVDIVGFHGQTLAHAPRAQGTLQVGNGQALADALGVPVVWDFRTADVTQGGEGAPLAPFFHFACAKWIGAVDPVAFLNLGGVGNLTFVDPSHDRPEDRGALLAFDTGPANAPVNDLMQSRLGLEMDEGGALAGQGRVAQGVVDAFLASPYFDRRPPKSLDRNDFNGVAALVDDLSDADAAATLTALCAAGVAAGIAHFPRPVARVLATGGGRKNPLLMDMLQQALGCPVVPVEDAGLDGDMLEAQAFAHLAVRVARGLPTSCPSTTGVRAPVAGGTLSRPGEASARTAG
ncbi:anhydro-N-acetylmuramic acid kinase [Chachezhania sediminis]|uniref:anhydro-N-acetylmuramic acid kinase n=1 Tax=Chachezhania sediminis TaxID=2599291 RepID=UPI00131BD758|nr:anhydro-N-acetylmuramic acid kinase [Chachezhania sediminis]